MLRIVTDSTSSISYEEAKLYNIDIVPLYVVMEGSTYKDRLDISDNLFYRLLKLHQPTTSQPTPDDFLKVFEKYPDDEILCITISEKLSGTFQSANIAKTMCNNKNIEIINSNTASLGIKNLILKAINMRDKNYNLSEVVGKINSLIEKSITLGMCDTMENLKRSGRISHMKFIAGSLLHIKPILIIKDGIIQGYHKKARGRQKAITLMIEALKEYDYDENYPLLIGYTHKTETANLLKDKLKENGFNVAENSLSELGSVIATHTGENTFIINFISKHNIE